MAGNSFAAGIEDGQGLYFPMTGPSFKADGKTYSWPEGHCFCLDAEETIPQPTTSPAPSFSSIPSSAPTQLGCHEKSRFEPIFTWQTDVYQYYMSDESYVNLYLPFRFPWINGSLINQVVVTSNGQINIDPNNYDINCCSVIPVNGTYNKPRIAFAQADLDPSQGSSYIYTRRRRTSFLISFQNVYWYGSGFGINAQVELFANGRISFCYGQFGNMTGKTFAAGVEDGNTLFFPLTGSPFNDVGITSEWPAGECYCVGNATSVITPAPSPYYSSYWTPLSSIPSVSSMLSQAPTTSESPSLLFIPPPQNPSV